ncbi:MAG: ISKra4 family transposase [Anaerolineaceae bacterium]|nr:MAG: ISKra4 family transposase [Anaerolineaceae bacterium]
MEEGTKLSDIENVMRKLLQKVGQCNLEKLLTRADDVQPTVPCECGGEARYVARRGAKLITVFSKVAYRRAYHLCARCHTGCAPLDQRLLLEPGQVSRALAPLLGLLGIGEAFDKAQKQAQHLLLLDISDNTIRKATQQLGETQALREEEWQEQSNSLAYLKGVERRQEPRPRRLYGSLDGVLVPIGAEWREMKVGSWYEVEALPRRQWPARYKQRLGHLEALKATNISYFCSLEKAGEFSELVWTTVCQRQADLAEELVFVADGAHWIWRLVAENFPKAVQILDWYHALEYLTPVANALFHEDAQREAWLEEMTAHLWFSRTQHVIDTCLELLDHCRGAEAAQDALTYYTNNLSRTDYVHWRSQGYIIGSGTVESGCKQIATVRLKCAGARWTEKGCSARRQSTRCMAWQRLENSG